MAAGIQPEKILRELRDLWDQLGRDQTSSGGVLRACAMTLVVIVEGEDDCEQVRRTLGVLMHDHPSRAVVLRAPGECGPRPPSGPEPEMSARVFAECWMPLGGSQQICAEGIEITANPRQSSEVSRLLVPLIVPDLPVVIWFRLRDFSLDAFEPLLPLAGKIIADSSVAPDPRAAIARLRTLHGARRVADLAWTRLTAWREALANISDEGLLPADRIAEARIRHGAPEPGTGVLYFKTWIERSVPGARVTLETASGNAGLQSVTLTGDGVEITIEQVSGLLEARGGERRSCFPIPPASEDALMHEELSILEADPVFDGVLAAFK